MVYSRAGRGAGHPDSPPFRTHRAQFRQWAQDKVIHVTTWCELEQRIIRRQLTWPVVLPQDKIKLPGTIASHTGYVTFPSDS